MAGCGLALVLAGCGSGGPSSGNTPPSPTPSAADSALCAHAVALRASLNKLTHVTVGSGMVNEITADLNDVRAALTAFTAEAGNQWHSQTAALNSALGNLRTAVSDLAAKPGAATVSGAATALHQVTTAAQDLLAAVNKRCPPAS